MSGGMLGVGVTGLLAYQRSLQAISHNISNANTEGYSRQRVELSTNMPTFQGGGYIGNGVAVSGIERVYDSFLTGQVRSYNSSFNQAEAYASNASLVDEMLADPEVGLMPAIEKFFTAIQGVSNDPTSLPARKSMVTQSDTLVDRFNYLNQRFSDIRSQINSKMSGVVSEINSLTSSIAEINRNIVLAPGGAPPNDLLDARDRMLGELSEKISISTVEQENGAVDVFSGNGQVLVINFDSRDMSITRNQYDISQFEVSIDSGGGNTQQISDLVTGGQLGGLLSVRSELLSPAQNSLGVLAIGLADTFNAQHNLGQDLNGNLGGDYFTEPGLQVLPGTGAPNAVTATLADSSQLTNDDYLLTNDDGTNFTLTRLSDNQTFAINSGAAAPQFTGDGFSLTIGGGSVAGDSFMVRPGRRGAGDLAMNIADPREVAAAAPIRTETTIGNAGSGQISPGTVSSTGSLPLGGDITITFNAGNLNIVGATPASVAYTSGATVNLAGTGAGISFAISGTPQDGDTFTISNNTNGVGDNRNSLLLAGLQNNALLENGNASYAEYYGGMVADVGIKTNQANLNETSQSRLLDQAMSTREALSGVNLDEEAANLVKFQQAYQAASQIIVASNAMFQTLLGALRG